MNRYHSISAVQGRVFVCAVLLSLFAGPCGFGMTIEELAARLEKVEAENRVLREKVARLEGNQDSAPGAAATQSTSGGVVQFDSSHSYRMLDPTTRINRKQQLLLESKQRGELPETGLVIGGAVTAIADYQRSEVDSKFGYLMRHPTANNQRTKDVSEAVLHSAQLSLTANLGEWVTAYSEILYDPEQSFGAGTITSLARNQLQLRRGYVLFGNLDESPLYLSLGKMATPFGLTDTVNPFTANTVWHAFGGLAYGVQAGYLRDGLNLSFMGVQGGAQFRANNTVIDGTSVPSKLNNYVADANYTLDFNADSSLLLGASYQRGTAYNQDYPVTHFSAGVINNPAFDVYGQLRLSNLLVHTEFAQTLDEWPGTFNPDIPQFAAHKVRSWSVGSKYTLNILEHDIDLSLDFSRFVAGPDGAPWEKQDQVVFGIAGFVTPTVKLFAEYVRTEGYVPLNFISGGSIPGPPDSSGNPTIDNTQTHSDQSGTHVVILGVNAAF